MLFRPRPAPVKKEPKPVEIGGGDVSKSNADVMKLGGYLDAADFATSKPVFKHRSTRRGRGATSRRVNLNKLLDEDGGEEKKEEKKEGEEVKNKYEN